MMLAALLCLGVSTVAQAVIDNNEVIGLCVEACSNNVAIRALGIGTCQEGYECRSNGCGHTCQKVTDTSNQIHFGACIEACSVKDLTIGLGKCPAGTECRFNGCGHTCQKIETQVEKRQIGICVEECSTNVAIHALGVGRCKAGYECKSDGCGHTCQKVEKRGACVIACGLPELLECQEGYECKFNGCGRTCQKIVE